MKKIKPYVFGLLLAWAVTMMAACGSTDNNASESSEGTMTQTTMEEGSSSRGDETDKNMDDTSGAEKSTGVIDGAMEDMKDAIDDGIGAVEKDVRE